MQRSKKPFNRRAQNLRNQVLEAALYNLYWVWSLVALILFGNPAEAQRIIQNTTVQVTGQEHLARKVVLKIFTDLATDPERHLDLFLRSAFVYEMQTPATDFSLTKKLLLCLRRQNLLSPEYCHLWEQRLQNVRC
ncbi:MAG: hypothetical protein QMC81_09965 [Thermoanaerobacterales bacterium]|nr:hypothetical protein [Thermoanaerobacterales bacterium]